jgi:hypothetical protein
VRERSEQDGLVHCTNEALCTGPPNAERRPLRSRQGHTTGPTPVERQKIQLIVACELGSTARRKPKTKQKSSTKAFVYTYTSILSFTYSLVANKTKHSNPVTSFSPPTNGAHSTLSTPSSQIHQRNTLDTAPNSCYKRPDPLRTQD